MRKRCIFGPPLTWHQDKAFLHHTSFPPTYAFWKKISRLKSVRGFFYTKNDCGVCGGSWVAIRGEKNRFSNVAVLESEGCVPSVHLYIKRGGGAIRFHRQRGRGGLSEGKNVGIHSCHLICRRRGGGLLFVFSTHFWHAALSHKAPPPPTTPGDF